jgi:hypothetical protein
MIDFFQTMRAFYQAHAKLFRAGHDSAVAPVVTATGVATRLVTFDSGRSVLHLVNHNYAAAFVPQPALSVTVPSAQTPTTVTLVSPDLPAEQPAQFSYANGQLTVDVGTLVSSVVVVIE